VADAELGAAGVPVRFSVLTDPTLTPKIFSIASLISVLLARGSTSKVYLPSSIRL